MKITKIYGKNSAASNRVGDVTTISFEPYCVTQNLSGAYSIILITFLCEAEGNLLNYTNETQNIRWEKISYVEELLKEKIEQVFFMHVNALKKFLNL